MNFLSRKTGWHMPVSSSLIRKFKSIPAGISRRWHEKRVSGLEIGERIKIEDLVCPLRYDILVRVDFISFLADNDGLSTSDFRTLLETPVARAYQTWFKEVFVPQVLPEIYHDDDQIRKHFYARVENARNLWESMSTQGFDYQHPISLRSGSLVQEVNGKTFDTSFYAGDGCHRIACLLVMGRKYLEPKEYEVVTRPELHPVDNTAILLEKLPISMSEYLSFISRGSCEGRTLAAAVDALAYVEQNSPSRLAELKRVFRHDLVHLR